MRARGKRNDPAFPSFAVSQHKSLASLFDLIYRHRIMSQSLVIDDLTDEELADLSARIAYRRSTKASHNRYSFAEIELWNELCDMFKRNQPIDYFVRGMDNGRGYGIQKFLTCARILDALVTKSCAFGTKKPTRKALRRLMLDCIRDWLKSNNRPPSPTSVLDSMEHIEHAVEQQYPGYIAAGLLSLVLDPLPKSEN